MTKIDDGQGVRNEQPLVKSGSLFFVYDRSMYVYYRPTHWRPLTEAEREKLRERVISNGRAAAETAARLAASI
jgi:hypothetical protein